MQKIPAEMRQISEMYFLTFLFVLSVEGLLNINKDILVIFRFLSCLTLIDSIIFILVLVYLSLVRMPKCSFLTLFHF